MFLLQVKTIWRTAKKNNALLQQNKISIADLPRPINFEQEIILVMMTLKVEILMKIVLQQQHISDAPK